MNVAAATHCGGLLIPKRLGDLIVLCNFASEFPVFVAHFLQSGRSLRRRFREETITDLMMGNLILVGGRRVIVEFPDEPVTGADMEWNFVNPDDKTFFRILIQAKQSYGNGQNWKRHSYRELFHTSGKGGKFQAEMLCDTARSQQSTFPLYAFYHPAATCMLARHRDTVTLDGVNLADGFAIEHLVKAAKGTRRPTQNKSLGVIHRHLFALSVIFCPPLVQPLGPMALAPGRTPIPIVWSTGGVGIQLPPRPIDIRQRLVDLRRSSSSSGESTAQTMDLPTVPEVATSIPEDVKTIIDLRDHPSDQKIVQPLDRWRITFVSNTPRDPRIERPVMG